MIFAWEAETGRSEVQGYPRLSSERPAWATVRNWVEFCNNQVVSVRAGSNPHLEHLLQAGCFPKSFLCSLKPLKI